jgi:hypothetical protein
MNYCHQSKKRIVNTEFFLSKEFLESVETFFLSLFFLFSGLRSICAYVMSTSSLICCTVFVIKIGQHLFATIHQFSMIWFSEKSNQMFAQHYEVIHAHTVADYRPFTVQLHLKTLLPCILLLTPAIEVIYYWDYRKKSSYSTKNCNVKNRLPLFQGSNTLKN